MALATAKKVMTQLKKKNIHHTCFLVSAEAETIAKGISTKLSLRETLSPQRPMSSLYSPLASIHTQRIIKSSAGGDNSFLKFCRIFPSKTAKTQIMVPMLRNAGVSSNKGKPKQISKHPTKK